MAKYNPRNHSPNPAEFQRLIETSRTLAAAGNNQAAMDAANNAVFYASNQSEVDQAYGEARVHSNATAEQRGRRRDSRRQREEVSEVSNESAESQPARGKSADRNLTASEAREIRQGYNFILRMAANDPTGSLEKFWQDLRKVIRDAEGDTTIIDAYVNRELPKVEYFRDLYGAQAEAAIQEARPELARDVERAVDLKRQTVNDLIEQYGIVLPEGQLDLLAREAWRSDWERDEIFTNLRPFLESTIAGEADLMGTAGDFETDLMSWASRNGLNLSRQAAAKYITNMTTGEQTFDDVKADLRRTYLAGMFPAWSDRIEAGFDPEVLFEPYRDTARRLLEVEDVGFDDPVLKSALQRVDANGKPVQMPLYQFEQEIRKDPRWEFTDNAYDVYSRVGTNLLRTFGFR